MITFPNAKINLGLRITERRPDGYHNLETIFYPIHLEDALEVVPLKDNKQEYDLKITGTPIDGTPEDNLVVRAYRLLKQDFDLPPIHIYMYKHIPLGAVGRCIHDKAPQREIRPRDDDRADGSLRLTPGS